MATVGDYLVRRLQQWGVDRIFGYPGDGINGITAALRQVEGELDFVQARHEEMSAFMAGAHAKFTGRLGVCLATSGPGAIHLLNGLYDARMDFQPVLAIVGQQKRMALGSFYQQEVDLTTLFKDVASDYVLQLSSPEQMRHAVDTACRVAIAHRTVTCLIIPNDLQEEEAVESPERMHGATYSGIGYEPPEIVPSDRTIQRAAKVLNAGKKVAMLVGAGALDATDEVIEASKLLGAGISKALLGRAAVPDELPNVAGAIGLLGTKPSWELMQKCDTFFMIGSSFPYSEFLPKEGSAAGVQIDVRPRNLSLRYPMDVTLHGDAKLTLRKLIPHLQRKAPNSWQSKIESDIREWWKVLQDRAMNSAKPINPQRVFWELSPRLPSRAIITADSGSAANWFARDLKLKRGMMASLSGNLATMGPGVPYAIAAKFAYPDRPVIALVGDGAMQMNGAAELLTVEKYWKEWKDPRLVVLVLNNSDLNQVTWEQRVMAGDIKFEASQTLPPFDYARHAQSLGLDGIRVEKPEDIGRAWDAAFAAVRPVVLDVLTDPEVPPMPPHISLEHAMGFLKSVAKGDPNRWRMVKGSAKEMADSVFAGDPKKRG